MAAHIKLDFKFWLNIFTFVALITLVVISRHQIADAFKQLADLKLIWLFMMIPLQLVNYYCVARLYQDYFKSSGEKIRMRVMYPVALELNFINHVFPSGGLSGFSYLSIRLKKEGISTAKSTLAQIIRFALTFLSFLFLLFIGMIILALRRQTSPLTILIGSSVAFLTLFGVMVAIYIISSESRIQAFVGFLPKAVNSFLRLTHLKRTDIINIQKVERMMSDLHADYAVVSKDWSKLKRPLIWALMVNVTDITTAYVVYVAFGTLINPGALIVAYAIANFAGLVAILPGGVGIYEGLMTAVLSSAGVDKALALSATVVYRITNMILFLPLGYFFYQKFLKQSGVSLQQAALDMKNQEVQNKILKDLEKQKAGQKNHEQSNTI